MINLSSLLLAYLSRIVSLGLFFLLIPIPDFISDPFSENSGPTDTES